MTAFSGLPNVLAQSVTAGESGLLVAVGSDGHFSDEQADAAIWTSPDGVSWTGVRDSDLFDPEAQVAVAVASGPGGFVAVGTEIRDGGEAIAPLAWTSSDGESWRRVVVDADGFVNAVAAGGPGLVAVGGGEVPVWTSPDGQSWTPGQADPQVFAPRLDVEDGFLVLQGVAAAADGRVVAVGWETTRSGTQVGAAWLSLDGVSWARVPHDDAVFGDGAGLTQVEDVVAGGPGFVAVGTEAEVAGGGIPFVYDQFAETSTTARGTRGGLDVRGRAGVDAGVRGAAAASGRGEHEALWRHDRWPGAGGGWLALDVRPGRARRLDIRGRGDLGPGE